MRIYRFWVMTESGPPFVSADNIQEALARVLQTYASLSITGIELMGDNYNEDRYPPIAS